ncbi:uncharacterized protein LOC106346916 [Brassica napus]|uniref:uncharacterized protein LOC106346916 n=1 Tax=Brassica napus TaxID=3708 RepID=UPI0020786DEC|nr:uncharacterized protein LOC106346916 [Brassica napus]
MMHCICRSCLVGSEVQTQVSNQEISNWIMYEDVGLLGFRVRLLEINQVFESIRQAFHHQKLDTNYSESLRCLVQPRMDSVKSVYEIHCINYFFTCKRSSGICDSFGIYVSPIFPIPVCRSYCTEKLKHSFQMTTMSQTLHGWTWLHLNPR